jgi:nitric oxide reductase large subunit
VTVLQKEALRLVLLVVVVDAVFVALYYVAGLREASAGAKLAFTVVWTVFNLAVVIRGLSRIRTARVHRKSA